MGAARRLLRAALAAAALGGAGADTICVGTFSSGEAYNQQCTSDRPLTIQNAITGAQPADTVLVFPGTFTGGVTDDIDWWSAATPDGQPNTVENAARNVRLNFMGKNLQLKSVAGPSETIITCDGLFDSFGLQFINGETHAALVEGFTVTKCGRFKEGKQGGGIRVLGHGLNGNTAFPETCTAVDSSNAMHASICGNIDLTGVDPAVDEASCLAASGGGTCQYYPGAGLTVRNCWFLENRGSNGAAIAVSRQGYVIIERVIMRGNVAEADGGGIYADVGNNGDGSATNLFISDSLIAENQAGNNGGGTLTNLNIYTSNLRISNSVIVDNFAARMGGGMHDPGTLGDFLLLNTIVAQNTLGEGMSLDTQQMFCGARVDVQTTDQPAASGPAPPPACSPGVGRREALTLSSYSSELAPGDKLVIGADKMPASLESFSRPFDADSAQPQLPFYYGVPGQVWYLPPPAMESCVAPASATANTIAACSAVTRVNPEVPFSESVCTSAHATCVYTPNEFRDPVTLTVSGMTLRPFRDMVEVLLIPKTTDSLEDIFDVECYTRPDASDYRGVKAVTRGGIPCVAWDAHSPQPHYDRNNPVTNPFDGLEDGPYCRNPDKRSTPWCYLTEATSTGRWLEACTLGAPVGACARDLDVMAKFTSNSTWSIFAGYNQGMFIKLSLDEEYMTEGGLTLALEYATTCDTVGCSGHGTCQEPEAGAPRVCACDAGFIGVDCSTPAVFYTRISGSNGLVTDTSAVNLQTALTMSEPNDLVRATPGSYSGVGNYDIVLGNVNVTFAGHGPLSTVIDCQQQGRGFYIDSSVAVGSVSVVLEGLTITNCYANDAPIRGPIGGAAFIKHAVVTFRNMVLRDNRADVQGGGIYGFRSTVLLEDTVVGPANTAEIGGGIALETTVLTINRAFVTDNSGTTLSNGSFAGNLNCFTNSRVDYRRGFHWKELGKSILELDACSCCNGCLQPVPALEVTQVTVDVELQENASLGLLPTKMVLQGSFMSYGDDSAATKIYVDGEPCLMRNVSSYQIICGLQSPYVVGQSISVRRSDGVTAEYPTQPSTCTATAAQTCATVDATAASGLADCAAAAGGSGACAFTPAAGSAPAACAASDATLCAQAAASSAACLSAGSCTWEEGPDAFPVYPSRGVNLDIIAVAPLFASQTSENNGRTKLAMTLKSQPQTIVEIPVWVEYEVDADFLAAGVPADFMPAVVETPVVYFTQDNWNESAQVVLSGVDDQKTLQMTHNFTVKIGPTKSMDINYADREAFEESMVNVPFDCQAFGAFGYVPQQVSGITTCVCDRGYEKDPVMLADNTELHMNDAEVPCVQCANGFLKPEPGNEPCELCPLTHRGDPNYQIMDTNNRMGSTDVSACVCRPGYVYNDTATSNNTCIECDTLCWDELGTLANLKNFDLKDKDTWCIDCDSSGLKLSEVRVRKGWWRASRDSSYIYQCPSTVSQRNNPEDWLCQGDDGSVPVENASDVCMEGSHGVMCTACDVDYAKLYTAKGGCLDCRGGAQIALQFVAMGGLFGFMIWTVYMSIKSAEDEDRTSTMLMKILISFTVTNIEVMKYRSQWPTSLKNAFQVQSDFNSKTSVSVSDITSFDCYFAGEPSEVRVWTKLVFYLMLPVASIVLPLTTVGPRFAYLKWKARGMHPFAKEFKKAVAGMEKCKEYGYAGVIVILYQVYPSTVNHAAAIFKCTPYQFSWAEHLASEQTVQCDSAEYEKYSIKYAGYGGLLGYAVGVPILLALLLLSIKGYAKDAKGNILTDEETGEKVLKMDTASISRKYGFLYGGFREERIWWEAVVLIRKLLFLLSATFLARESISFRIAVSMTITVTFMTIHLVLEPYPEEFKSVSAMECFSMLVVFFTYGGVLMMEQSLASADRDDVCDECFTPREWFFFFLIMAVNFSFMVVIMLMVAWDIWRKSHHHIKKHGIKASLGHVKDHVKQKTKIVEVKNFVQSPRESSKNLVKNIRSKSRDDEGGGLVAEAREKRERARKHESAKMNWLRGLSGATATVRTESSVQFMKSHVDDAIDRDALAEEVKGAASSIEHADDAARAREEKRREARRRREQAGTTVSDEEVQELKEQVAKLQAELDKQRKGNLANRLRLGLGASKLLEAQSGAGRRRPTPPSNAVVQIDDIDGLLASERDSKEQEGREAQLAVLELKRETDAKRGARRKWEEDEEELVRDLEQGIEEVTPAEPVRQLEPEPEPEPAPRPLPSVPGESGERQPDASQMVGTKIFYGNADREGAGRNAKQFLRAVQEVKNQGRKNAQLQDVIDKALQKDHSWFGETRSELGHPAAEARSPSSSPTGSPTGGGSESRASAVLTAGKAAPPAAALTPAAVNDDVRELSQGEINDQVEVWQRANRDAEVQALKTKMMMLSRFSAATLNSTKPEQDGGTLAPVPPA